MSTVVEAIFDGSVFRPSGEVRLEPNTRVHITVEVDEEPLPEKEKGKSFLSVARSLKLQGPTDFSQNIDEYLYEGKEFPE